MNKEIELQSLTNTPDGMGGFTETWTTEKRVRAAVWPISAGEQIRATSPTVIGTHRVRIRYFEGILPSWRVKFGDRYFTIVSVINQEERNEWYELLCQEAL